MTKLIVIKDAGVNIHSSSPLFSEITSKGDLSLTFDNQMADPSGTQNQFAVKVDDALVAVTSVVNTNTQGKIKLVLDKKATGAKKISISYTRGDTASQQIKFADGSIVDSFVQTWEEWDTKTVPVTHPFWTIKFSLDVDPLTVTDNNIYIIDQNGAKLQASLSTPDSKTVKLTPQSAYTSGQIYNLYISKAVHSALDDKYLRDNIHMKISVS